jgi:NAD/NADP transhydrogenase alpha subunit
VLDYNKRIDGKVLDCKDFYKTQRNTLVERFTKVSDIVITGHFHGNNAPDIITREMLQSKDCKIKVDVSCDINGPVAAHLDHPPLQNRFMVICLLMIKK